MSQHRIPITDELRQSTRFAKERGAEGAVLWFGDGEPMLFDVHDESLGGLGLYVDRLEQVEQEAEASIIYGGELMTGRIRHIEPQQDGGYVVGFECTRDGLSNRE